MGTLKTTNIQTITGSGTLTLGTSGETLALGSGVTVSGNGLVGITMADQWRLTATTNSGTNADITTNWERNDNSSYGSIGTGLTESSGIFSFSQTGIYLIIGSFQVITQSDAAAGVRLLTTLDNSSYTTDARGYAGDNDTASVYGMATFLSIFDVTNISTHKMKFDTTSFAGSTRLTGNTDIQHSGFTCLRIGDT